jgi:hypothetical protein
MKLYSRCLLALLVAASAGVVSPSAARAGGADTFYLDKGVVLMQEWMRSTKNPHYEGFFLCGDRKPHCWIGPVTESERLREIAQYMLRTKPEGTTTPWWRY